MSSESTHCGSEIGAPSGLVTATDYVSWSRAEGMVGTMAEVT